jgi:hypothetical protein
MKDGKFGLRAFGLAIVAALGLMAFSAVAAQAENLTDGGKAALFEILKSSALVPGATFTGKLEKWTDGLVHEFILVEKSNLAILCSQIDIEEGKFLSDKEALAKVRLLECRVFNFAGTEEVPGCFITNSKSIVFSYIILPKKHEGESFLLFEPDGAIFTIIEFEKEKGCPLPIKNEIKGTFGALVKEKEAVVHLITFSAAIQTLLGDKATFGVNPLVIDSNWLLELTGIHKGCSWGIV